MIYLFVALFIGYILLSFFDQAFYTEHMAKQYMYWILLVAILFGISTLVLLNA